MGIKGLVTMGSHRSYVTKPDGKMVYLPSDVQLFECIDGKYFQSNEKISKEVFEEFLESKPMEYTIQALLTFKEKRGRERKKGGPP